MAMTKVRELTEGDVFDLLELPVEVDLEENPLAEYALAVFDSSEPDWAPGSSKLVIHTREHGSWAVDPDAEVQVQTRVRR
jgi:hypothetical protein